MERAKASLLGQHLLRAARLFDEAARRRLQERGITVRGAHLAVMPHLDHGGTRPAVLATRMGISRQALSRTLRDMEAAGVLERLPDPDDGRALIVRLNARGREALLTGLAALAEVESAVAEHLDEKTLKRLRKSLSALAEALELTP